MPGEEVALALLPMITSSMGAGGQYLENMSKAKAADYNALGSEQRIQAIRQASDWNLAMINRRKAKFLSSQKTLYAKAGVKMEGSPMEVMIDTATQFELDKISENYTSQVQMAALKSEAQASKIQAKQYRFAAAFQPSMTLLTGAAKAGMNLGVSQSSGTGSKYLTGKPESIGSYTGYRKFTG